MHSSWKLVLLAHLLVLVIAYPHSTNAQPKSNSTTLSAVAKIKSACTTAETILWDQARSAAIPPGVTSTISSLTVRPAKLTIFIQNSEFEIWYTDDDITYPLDAITDAQALLVLDYFTQVKSLHITQWGYTAPASPGNLRYEVWVSHLGTVSSGFTFDLEEAIPVNTSRIRVNSRLVRGAAGQPIDSDDYGDSSRLIGLIGHEYHHATQQTYLHIPCNTCPTNERLWLTEASGNWIEYQTRLHLPNIPGTNSWENYKGRIEFFTSDGWRGLTSIKPDSGIFEDWYDGALFFYFISNNAKKDFSSGGTKPVAFDKSLWEELQTRGDWAEWPQAMDAILAATGVNGYGSFAESVANFVEALLNPQFWFPWPSDDVTADTTFRSPDENDANDNTVEVDLDSASFPLVLTSSPEASVSHKRSFVGQVLHGICR